MQENFDRCLAETLKWEGAYSNHPDDPGGPTMRGITQGEYDIWRKKQRKSKRPVKQITDDELRTIYKTEYWDVTGCGEAPSGYDLCIFDAAVNSGVKRSNQWCYDVIGAGKGEDKDLAWQIDEYCDTRLTFLQGTGRKWRVFGAGWSKRVAGIRAKAHAMAGATDAAPAPETDELHAGMRGPQVLALQTGLRKLGYPVGNIDGIFGEQTYRAVILFQHDNGLDGQGDIGIWKPGYDRVLASASPMLPGRTNTTPGDLQARGDKPLRRLNWLQRAFGWLFGASAIGQVTDAHSVADALGATKAALDPLQDVFGWVQGHVWLMVAAAAVIALTLIRLMIADHVEAYKNMDYQGPAPGDAVPVVLVAQGSA